MELIPSLGGIGAGLVWGWLLALFLAPGSTKPVLCGLALSVATLLALASVHYLAGGATALLHLGATIVSLGAHLGWRAALRQSMADPR